MNEVIEKTIDALKKHGFKAEAAKDKDECREMVLALIPENAKVGVPGSASVRATGVVDELKKRGNELYDHWREGINPGEAFKVRKLQIVSDVLLTSTNALSMTGEMVNVDGVGNRVAPMIFGPGKVIIVAGKNKIVPDLEAARERIKKIAAPIRAKELNLKLPCVEKGECTDCNSPMRICRAEVIIHRPPSLTQTTVIIVDEELGN